MNNNFLTMTLLLLLFSGCTGDSVENAEKKNTGKVSTTDINNKNLDGKTRIEDSEEPELTVEERVEQIRTWYGEIQKIGMQNCKTKSKTRYERGLSEESDHSPYKQIVKTCNLNEDFELIRGNFLGYEWGQEVSIYKRKGKIFFIFVTGGAETWSYEYRYYFDSDENLIRHLVKEADYGNEISGPNKEIKIDPKKKNVNVCAKEYFNEIDFVLGTK